MLTLLRLVSSKRGAYEVGSMFVIIGGLRRVTGGVCVLRDLVQLSSLFLIYF